MKSLKYLAVLALTLVGCFAQAGGAGPNFISLNLMRGTNLTLYTGTSATTFKYNDSYATNRTYVAPPYTLNSNRTVVLSSAVIPKATNSTTGVLVPSFEVPGRIWPNKEGGTATNINVTVYSSLGSDFTNTVAMTFVRSTDGGVTYPLDDVNGTWSFTYDPSLSATSTNISPAFLTGASHVRLWKIVAGANAAGASSLIIGQLRVSGFSP